MSLHDELMADAVQVLSEVHGTPGGLKLQLADGQELTVDVISSGETRLEHELRTDGSTATELMVEKLTLKVAPVTTAGEPWQPSLAAACLVGDDDRPWKVSQVGGLGTSVIKLDLTRPSMNRTGRSGRFRGER